jgi:Zn-dependent protease/CBS domain-containing protein
MMFGRRFKLFKLFGFEVRIDASWIIIAVLVTWSLALGYFPFRSPGLSQQAYWWMGIAGALGLFAAIVFHELCHSLVARRYGLQMKGITLFVFGGVAEMGEEPANARTEFMMAIAGPIASILIGLISYFVYLSIKGLWPVEIVSVIYYLYWINLLLAAFNLIPAFPLDGGRVLRSILWSRKKNLPQATRIASSIGSGFGLVLMALGVVWLLNGNFIGAVWWFLIGWFLRDASRASYQQLLVRTALQGEPVRYFMKTDPVTVNPETSIQDLVDGYIYRHHYKMFPVVSGSQQLVGCVTSNQVKTVPRPEWSQHHVAEIMQPCGAGNTIAPDADAVKALSLMSKTGASRLMVVDHGHLEAVLTLRDLLDFLSTKLDLEGVDGNGHFQER